VLTGLDFLATQDMMHGDITCSNILLSPRGDVKVGKSSSTQILLAFANLSIRANPDRCVRIDPQSPEMCDTEALGFVMLQLMERGRGHRERLTLEHPDKWSPQADKFLQATASNSAKKLLLVRLLNPQFVHVLIVSARILEEFTAKRGTCELGWLRSDILAHPILSRRAMMGHLKFGAYL
jgi:hypothetical protein